MEYFNDFTSRAVMFALALKMKTSIGVLIANITAKGEGGKT